MKKALIFTLSVFVLVMLQRCNDEPVVNRSKSSFYFKANSPLPEDATLLLSIESSSGELLMDLEQVDFRALDNGYVTTNLDLAPGNYSFKDLVVVDQFGNIRYAAPRSNSLLCNQECGLITIGTDESEISGSKITLMATSGHRPEDFGMKRFTVPLKISLNISVQLEDGDTKADAATALLLHNRDTIMQFELAPKLNHLRFDAVEGENYSLFVYKDGYSSETRIISGPVLSQKPIVVKLKPALSLVTVTTAEGYSSFELDGWPGALIIDWGDGTSEPINLGDPGEVDVVRDHLYAAPGRYYVNVTGALDQINTLLFSQGLASATDRINLEHLPKLVDLRFMYTHAPKSVDASQNHELVYYIFWHTDVEEVKVSTVRVPFSIELEGSRHVTTASFDQLIDDVYDYSVRSGRRGGFISWLYFPNYPDFSTIAPVGPPSPATIEKMIILQNEYGWDFGPDADYNWGSGDPW